MIFIIYRVTRGPTQNLGSIGKAVLTFIGYKQKNKQKNRQTVKQNIYIEYRLKRIIKKVKNFQYMRLFKSSKQNNPERNSPIFLRVKFKPVVYESQELYLVRTCEYYSLYQNKGYFINHMKME